MLNTQEQRQFMQLLVKLVDVNNTLSRAPLRIVAAAAAAPGSATPLPRNGVAVADRRSRLKGRSL
jgi:hypothetical protein